MAAAASRRGIYTLRVVLAMGVGVAVGVWLASINGLSTIALASMASSPPSPAPPPPSPRPPDTAFDLDHANPDRVTILIVSDRRHVDKFTLQAATLRSYAARHGAYSQTSNETKTHAQTYIHTRKPPNATSISHIRSCAPFSRDFATAHVVRLNVFRLACSAPFASMRTKSPGQLVKLMLIPPFPRFRVRLAWATRVPLCELDSGRAERQLQGAVH